MHQVATSQNEFNALDALEFLNEAGAALSQEKDINRLLEIILTAATKITNADGGTLYRLIDGELKFEIVLNKSLNIKLGGTTGNPIPFQALPLHHPDGSPNNSMIAAYVALEGKSVNIADAYASNIYVANGFDFSGTRNFDKQTGYRSTSFLTIPMENH